MIFSVISIRMILTIAAVVFFLRLLLTTSIFHFLNKSLTWLLNHLHAYHYYTIPKHNHNDLDGEVNHLYDVVSTYVSSLPSLQDTNHAHLITTTGHNSTNSSNNNNITVSLHPGQSVRDSFLRAPVTWTYITTSDSGEAAFVLKIKLKDKGRILRQYIQHIHKVTDEIQNHQTARQIRVHVVVNQVWRDFPFTHPATFDTVVMIDNETKTKVIHDLDQFLRSKQYYNRIGRVWRRSYLLHGPGSSASKSSFVAAMAKFLRYDIYDVDITSLTVGDDVSRLKTVLLTVPRKSLLLIENLNQSSAMTVAGIMNVIDGVTSRDERVVVFTTREREHEQSPLRVSSSGLFDVEVNFPVSWDFNTFKAMANTHLGLKEHKLFDKVEDLLTTTQTTTSTVIMSQDQVSEMMVKNRCSPTRAIRTIITTLENDQNGGGSVGRRGGGGRHHHQRSESCDIVSGGGEWRSASVKGKRGEKMMGDDESDEQSVNNNNKRPESVRGGMRGKLYGMLKMRSGRKEELGEVAVAMGLAAPPIPIPLPATAPAAPAWDDRLLEGSSHHRLAAG